MEGRMKGSIEKGYKVGCEGEVESKVKGKMENMEW